MPINLKWFCCIAKPWQLADDYLELFLSWTHFRWTVDIYRYILNCKHYRFFTNSDVDNLRVVQIIHRIGEGTLHPFRAVWGIWHLWTTSRRGYRKVGMAGMETMMSTYDDSSLLICGVFSKIQFFWPHEDRGKKSQNWTYIAVAKKG